MTIEKQPFNIDMLGPDLGFIYGVIQLFRDSLEHGELDIMHFPSLSWVLSEVEERCTRVIGMFEGGTDIELQHLWNKAHPDKVNPAS